MKKSKLRILKSVAYLITFLSATTLPITATSCGASSEPVKGPQSRDEVNAYAKSVLYSLRVETTSLNDDLKYNTIPLPSGEVSDFKYLVTVTSSLEEVKQIGDSQWTQALPKASHFDTSLRNLWARVVTRTPNLLQANEQYFNLTDSSNIRSALSHVDSSPLFAAIDLTKIKLRGYPGAVIYELNNTLPIGVAARFFYQPTPSDIPVLIAPQSIGNYLEGIKLSLTSLDFLKSSLQVELAVTDSKFYVLTNNKRTSAEHYFNIDDFSLSQN